MSDVKHIGDLFGHVPDVRTFADSDEFVYQSLVGVEYELEGVSPSQFIDRTTEDVLKYWNIIDDGSLRGRNIEAVLKSPLTGKDLQKAIDLLCTDLRENWEGKLSTNFRTSLHVHLDVRDLTPEQFSKLFLLYVIMELPLFQYVGISRKKSNYCVPAGYVVDLLDGMRGLYEGDYGLFTNCLNEQGKYAAVNLLTLQRFGSLEFRQHPGTYSAEITKRWINMLLAMKKWAVEVAPEPRQFPEYLSGVGPQALLEEVFADLSGHLLYPMFVEDCYEGIRRVQDIVFAPDMRENSVKLIKKLREEGGEADLAKQFKSKKSKKSSGTSNAGFDEDGAGMRVFTVEPQAVEVNF